MCRLVFKDLQIYNVKLWRACFPHALSDNLASKKVFDYEDFKLHMKGVRGIAANLAVTTRQLGHLRGSLRTLDVRNCTFLKDKSFELLLGTIHTLDISWCHQLTDAALENVQGTIKSLNMNYCGNITGQVLRVPARHCPHAQHAALRQHHGQGVRVP